MAFSQSQQHLYGQQQVNMQQRFHQQALSAPSLPDLMAEHQKQWHDHLVMTGSAQNLHHVNPPQMQQNNFNTNNNNNNYSPQQQQYAMWQQRYQQQQNVSHSAMNITHYQQMMAQQQQQQQQQQMMYQMPPPPPQQQQPQPQQYISPRTLFQQQAQNNTNQNCYASTGQLTTNNNNYNNNRNFMSQTAITDMAQLDEFEEKEESVDHEHDSFVPPAPQNNQEIEKYVNWQAKRRGIDDGKRINLEVVKRQNVSAQNLYTVSAKNSNNCAKKDSFDDICNSNNSNIIYESWLNKKGKINKAMQLRYCKALKDRKLAYFQRAGDKEKKGFVDLTQVSGINMYLPKIFESKKNDIMDVNKIKQDAVNGFCPFKLKTVSLKGNKNSFGFELVTNKRVWVFSCADSGVFKKWMSVLKRLCFGKCFHSGYLRKTGPKYKSWKRRFFVISDWNEMRYFEDDTLSVQKGMIELNKITKICAAKPKQYNYANCIELHTPQRIWVLETETNQNREVWLNGIRNIVS